MSNDHLLIEYLLSGQSNNGKDDTISGDLPKTRGNASPEALPSGQDQQKMLKTKKITDEMPGGFFIYRADESEEIIYANKALVRMFNCKTLEEFQEWTGNTFRGLVHPDDLEQVEASIKQQIAVSQYDLDYVEYRIIQKGGGIRWIEDYGHFIHSDFAGDVFYVFVGDATEKRRRLMEEKAAILDEKKQERQDLQDQIDAYGRKLEVINQEQLRRLELIEGLSIDYESIFYVDFDKGIFQPYRTSRRIRDRFEKVGQICKFSDYNNFLSDYITLWVHPDDREAFSHAVDFQYIRDRLSENKAFHVNYRVVENGKEEHLLLWIVNVGSADNGAQVVIGCRSVDDRVRHEMEQNRILEEALGQTKASGMVKNIFLSNMSHDIRTPMNAIVGYTALAKTHMGDAGKLQDYLEKIEESSNQLIQLVDDILELSRIESDKFHIEEKVCDLRDIAQEIRTVIEPQAKEKGISFTMELGTLVHVQVYSDRKHLVEPLLRIASNAVKYTPEGGSVVISILEQKASQEFASYQFVVEDTGIGISESFLEHIFEPFERQKNTTMSGVQGTGLGLTIAKNIVEIMGGTIDVSSVAGIGSRFVITMGLRLYENPSEPAVSQPQEVSGLQVQEEPCGQGQGRILLVEDNEFNLEIEVELLTDSGFVVDTAIDGSIAVEKVKNSKPGDYFLILMDIQMPVMDGHSATRAIRRLEDPALANIPIVALSANNFEEDQKKSMDSGMNAHMAKPINLPRLLELINGILRDSKS